MWLYKVGLERLQARSNPIPEWQFSTARFHQGTNAKDLPRNRFFLRAPALAKLAILLRLVLMDW
jgi:hypothetical protein